MRFDTFGTSSFFTISHVLKEHPALFEKLNSKNTGQINRFSLGPSITNLHV
jgi:hypothetical protein